jgi:hypothetical protein
VTTYAINASGRLIAVWPGGAAHRWETVDALPAVPITVATELARCMTRLSDLMWQMYSGPVVCDLREQMDEVEDALKAPHLPEQGTIRMSLDPVVEAANQVGRALLLLADPQARDRLAAEIHAEADAVCRADLGDYTGRAAQAVEYDRSDISPVQAAVASQLLSTEPLGSDALLYGVDPGAAAVAAVHWVVAAADLVAEPLGLEPYQVFDYAAGIQPGPVTVPERVVAAVTLFGLTPREVTTGMLGEARAVREGQVPAVPALLQRVDLARQQSLVSTDAEKTLVDMLSELTPLEPARAGRDLLEQLLDAIRQCLLLYRCHLCNGDPVVFRSGRDEPGDTAYDRFGELVRNRVCLSSEAFAA